jgi:hypothetical protein
MVQIRPPRLLNFVPLWHQSLYPGAEEIYVHNSHMRTARFASECASVSVSRVCIREFKEMKIAGCEVGSVERLFHKLTAWEPVASLEPSDFKLFGPLKIRVAGKWFPAHLDMTQATISERPLTPIFCMLGYKALVSLWNKCLYVNGDHVALWWISSASLVPYILRQNKFLDVNVFDTVFFQISLHALLLL